MTITTQELSKKLSSLTKKVEELNKKVDIDPITSTTEQIIENAKNEQQARQSVAHLETVIAELKAQLRKQEAEENARILQGSLQKNWEALDRQADRFKAAVKTLEEELMMLRQIGKAIASQHQEGTGRLALDDRIPESFNLPKVEKLQKSIIIHVESRNLI